MTGESLPRDIFTGDQVFSGTLNQKGSFVFIARKVGVETRLSRIVEAVKEAMENKPPVQLRVDKIASVFVPAIMGIALITFLMWLIFGGAEALPLAIRAMVAVLIIACPCALGLATPTAVMVGIGRGASRGILIRDAAGLEKCARLDTIVLDKTGTVTAGKPEVTGMHWIKESDELKRILLGMEMLSEHPLAEPVVNVLKKSGNIPLIPEEFHAIPGRGITASHAGMHYAIGNEALMQSLGIDPSGAESRISAESTRQATTLWFSEGKKVKAVIQLSDQVKPTSRAAVEKLKQSGMDVHLLTGDNAVTARIVAEASGIPVFRAECLPGDKADYITALKSKGKKVGMVGDGINDSQALALADVSMAMGSGSDISMGIADMTLVTSDLIAIPDAIRLSKLTVRTIRQNLFWAFFYNLVAIPLAAGLFYPLWGILLNPMIAGAAMALSSVSVVSNSLRLKYRRI
jgi:Cu2+-exporting ATPase